MMLITALEAVCDLLPYFAVAALFKAYDAPGLLIGALLLLVFFASLLLQKTKAAAFRILCGLLPALSLLLAGQTAQLLFTLPALLLWFVIAVSGKCGIHYDDYKYWFGIPAVPTLLILLISVPRLPETGLSVLCGAAYLALGVLVLRRKRMGAGASAGAKLLNLAELFCAALCGILLPDLPKPILIPLCFLAAMVVGALWGSVVAFLKVKWGINEVLSMIMFNWIAFYLSNFIAGIPAIHSEGSAEATKNISANASILLSKALSKASAWPRQQTGAFLWPLQSCSSSGSSLKRRHWDMSSKRWAPTGLQRNTAASM